MIDERTREVLEWDEVLRLIAARAFSKLGQEYVASILPATRLAELEGRQAPLSELIALYHDNAEIPLGGLTDVRPTLDRVRPFGAVLEPEYWRPLLVFFRICSDLARLRERIDRRAPSLTTILTAIEEFSEFGAEIDRIFDADGAIRDSASPELHAARQALRSANQRIFKAVNRLLVDLADRGVLQESFSSVRGGRHVFPIRQSFRGRVQGILHGTSASGETAWIEPAELVEQSNEIEALKEAEEREVIRILALLSDKMRALLPFLDGNVRVLRHLDGLCAVARTAVDKGWAIPLVLPEGALRLFNAHHPLLNLRAGRSVPITMLLDAPDRCVVLSGPNAGGKTTAMKAVGLLVLLVHCGFPVPAFPDSTIPFFENVLADIGDAQNLSEGLSTFSGHIRRIRAIWDQAGPRTLILLDELGTGTDPQEGGALALALLEGLYRRAALTFTTSHLNPVKQWADDTKGARNASFSLDPGTHEPTFRLRLDLPGASEALEIAAREGLPVEVLDRARSLVGERHLRMGELLRRIEDRERALSQAAREAEARAKSLGEQEALARARVESLRHERRELREQALREREAEIRKWREQIETQIAALPSEDDLARRREALVRSRAEAMKSLNITNEERRRLAEVAVESGAIVVGQNVFVGTIRQWGELKEYDAGRRRCRVIIGKIETVVSRDDLYDHDPRERRAEQEDKIEALEAQGSPTRRARSSRRVKNALRNASEYAGPSSMPQITMSGRSISTLSRPGSMELDLHGCRVEEALAMLDKFIDQSLLASFPYVKICHGTGTGRLYRAVHEFLRGHRAVRSFRFGTTEEGGGGMTIVNL
jgi:DNA mismatch repair protein MutS2